MRKTVDNMPSPGESPPGTLFGGLLIPFLGLGMLHGVMALFDAMLA
jgi:hypothetical protein